MPVILKRLSSIAASLLVPLNCLLIFLVIMENRVVVPSWLQVAGRMHPLVLHFPIVLILLFFLLQIVPAGRPEQQSFLKALGNGLLFASAFSAVITALMGFFLSREPGYDTDSVNWHKWGGILLASGLSALYWGRNYLQPKKYIWIGSGTLAVIVLLVTGHSGAGITHGQNFLLAPVTPEKQRPLVPLNEAILYTHVVEPILEDKCMSCHNNQKAKGELVMETKELLLKGGKDGALWDTAAPDLGLMMKRIHLPEDQKKHMPPAGKPQLTDEEIDILTRWIRKGASFDMMVKDLDVSDTLRQLAISRLNTKEAEKYDFAAADENTVKKLSDGYRYIYPVALESPALNVDFYNREVYNSKRLEELQPLAGQIVNIDLGHMPVKDEDLSILAKFSNLRHLNLNFTSITGAGLARLKSLPHLKDISLSGNKLSLEDLKVLESLPELERVYVWSSGLSNEDLEKLSKTKGKITYETGFSGDTLLLQLTPPILENEEDLLTGPTALRMKHYIQGTMIRYTLDGSEPDSIHSPLYDDKVVLKGNTVLKARAYKSGWLSSNLLQHYFFSTTYTPDSAALLMPPEPKYKADGAATLIDHEKGSRNIGDGKWLGFRNNDAKIELFFKAPKEVKNVTVSILRNIDGYIMPPYQVQLWGGTDKHHMKPLGNLKPEQPVKGTPNSIIPLEINFDPVKVSYLQLLMKPLPSLPSWHPGKGQKGWIFVDEIMLN
jgi:uncharacterized membrane protein